MYTYHRRWRQLKEGASPLTFIVVLSTENKIERWAKRLCNPWERFQKLYSHTPNSFSASPKLNPISKNWKIDERVCASWILLLHDHSFWQWHYRLNRYSAPKTFPVPLSLKFALKIYKDVFRSMERECKKKIHIWLCFWVALRLYLAGTRVINY